MVNLQFDPHDPIWTLKKIGRLFFALSRSLSELDEFYKKLTSVPQPLKPSFWPSICQYNDVTFEYCLRFDTTHLRKLVFLAKALPNEELIVVKFIRSYCATAHSLLAKTGLAPRLLYFSGEDKTFHKPDGLDMVVMEYIHGDGPLSEAGRKDVCKAIELLHEEDLVFGDLRLPNVIATRESAMLIDFDWSGKADQVVYPLLLNTTDIKWPYGVAAGMPIRKEHDLHMLQVL